MSYMAAGGNVRIYFTICVRVHAWICIVFLYARICDTYAIGYLLLPRGWNGSEPPESKLQQYT